jgi:hypothetical protein
LSTVAVGQQARAFAATQHGNADRSAHRHVPPSPPPVPLRRVPCSEQRTPRTRRRGNFQALQWVPCVRTGKLCARE